MRKSNRLKSVGIDTFKKAKKERKNERKKERKERKIKRGEKNENMKK